MIRRAAVAGRFYTAEPAELARQIREFCETDAEKRLALGCMAPHAGYMYSGHVAGAVYGSLQIPTKCILLGPRHFPGGERMAILSEGSWETPFGEAQIDVALGKELKRQCGLLREDAVAHSREHSLEVQLPFLQQLAPGGRFVPVVLATDRYEELEALGNAVAQTVAGQSEPVLVIASSDMNHYESDEVTRRKDRRAIDRILALDARGLYDTVRSVGITMCGYAAAVAMLVAVQKLGATEAKLVRYATSGDINGDREQVVGYAGMVVR
jgi:MEMO1 family protein